LLSKYNINIENCSFLHVFAFLHAYNATYNSLGGCSKALSTLTTAPCKEKRKKQVRIKKYKQSDNIDE